MKQQDSYARDDEPAAPRRLPWDADNTTPDGPTSLDILVAWMKTPGKYERLHSGQRRQAVQNILASLKKNGIVHRSDSSIRSKIRSIENQYRSAQAWLEERDISGDDVVNGNVDSEIEAEVLAFCPLYCELVPVLRHSGYLNETVSSQKSAAGANRDRADTTDSDDKSKSTNSMKKRKKEKERCRSNKQHKRTESAVQSHVVVDPKSSESHQGVPSVLNCIRQTTTYGAIHRDILNFNGAFQRTDKCEIVVREPGVQLPPEIQHDVNEVKLNHLKKHSEAVLKSEDSMREAMMTSDLDAKRDLDQVHLQLEMVMARQVMKTKGVPQDEIEHAMPLPQLGKK